jgi:hypothetical protein
MLYTRNAFLFRKFYKEEVAREQGRLDLNFVGSLHPDKSRKETGFSKLIYGNREDLGKLLGTIALNVAADDQAIDDGREAIINDYAGPIIFSWNEYNQFSRFLKGELVGVYGWGETKDEYTYDKDKENAWLIKLLYTCFPSNIGERIRLQDYDTQEVKFEKEELKEMRLFLKDSLQDVNLTEDNYLKSGSIFFLKLGEGKSKFLDDGIDKIKSGLSYSFKFLNSLKKIYINGEEIKAQEVMDYSHSFPIGSSEFKAINPKNKNRDIKFTFAYYRDCRKAENLRNESVPNLYTFFSMDEEKNGFSFLLHCNAFDMNNDRRKLQANSQINEKLLPLIAKNAIQYIDNQKEHNRNLSLSLYANLLLSKEPQSKPHINNSFYKFFKEYISDNIPTLTGYSDNAQNVKIKNTFLKINPSDIGCSEIDWFYWYNEKKDDILIKESQLSDKLGLEKWDVVDLFKYAIQHDKMNEVNDWIKQLEFETSQLFAEEKRNTSQVENKKSKPYYSLLSEINRNILKSNIEFISKIKLFKFSDGNFYSLNEIFNNDDTDNKVLLNPYFEENKFICPCIKSELSEEEKLSLLDFLLDQWVNYNKKEKIKLIDWSKIGDNETQKLLGFNPKNSVYPNEYACESEQLPDYLIDWISNDEQKLQFLSDLSVWIENSVIVELRKFLKGNIDTFNKARLSRTERFNNDETNLFNTFEWLKENEIELETTEQYETFKKVVEVINDSRGSNGILVLQEEYDFDKLQEESTEWKTAGDFTIYQKEGQMAKLISLDEINSYVFYRYSEGDFVVNENTIYINNSINKKIVLQKVASDEKNNFSFENLWTLFGDNSRDAELAAKDKEIERLKNQLSRETAADIDLGGFSNDLPSQEQINWNEEARKIVKEELELQGYQFINGIGEYGIIDGVKKDGTDYPPRQIEEDINDTDSDSML